MSTTNKINEKDGVTTLDFTPLSVPLGAKVKGIQFSGEKVELILTDPKEVVYTYYMREKAEGGYEYPVEKAVATHQADGLANGQENYWKLA